MIALVNDMGYQWAEYFGLAVVQNTVFLTLVFGVLYLLKNASANTKVVVGSIGSAKLLLPPFLPVSLPFSSYDTVRALPQTVMSPLLGRPTGSDPGTAAAVAIDALGLVFTLWALWVVSNLLITVLSTARLAWKLRDATEVSDDATRAIIPDGRVRVCRSERIGMPLCLGVFPHKIFVPLAWDQWTDDCRRTVVAHEMAHIRRHDGVFLVIQILTQALYFFHPLVWILNRKVKEYREMACDDASAGFRPASRVEYSRCLVEIAESVMQSPIGCGSASALLEHKHELLNRVKYQMEGAIKMSKRKTGIVLAALALIALPLSWYYSDAAPVATANPKAAPGEEAGGASHLSIVKVSIGAEGELAINETKTSYEYFRKNMQKAVAGQEEKVVIAMACDDGVSMDRVFKIHAQLREMGLMKMTYVTSEGKDLTLMLPPLDYKEKLSEVPEKHISTLAVQGGGVVVLQGKKLKTAKLGDEIRKMLAMDDNMILSVIISEKATYGDFMTVLDVAKSADCPRILINDPTG